jgi:hypothetical protein
MAAVLVGLPQIDEAEELVRAYGARGDCLAPPLGEAQRELLDTEFEL